MSLRLRLTLFYMSLLSGVVVLLSIVMYTMINVVMVNQIDGILQNSADSIMDHMLINQDGSLSIETWHLSTYRLAEYQVWSDEGELLFTSDPGNLLNGSMVVENSIGEEVVYQRTTVEGNSYRSISLPLKVNGEVYGWLQVSISLMEMQETQRTLQLIIAFIALLALTVSGVAGWLVTGKVLDPLVSMVQITKNISSTEDLSLRLPVPAGRVDEVGQLGLTFNKTLARLERLFSTQRRFLADVSHELRTPLTVIKGNLGLMRLIHDFDQEALDSVESEVDRLTRLVNDLLLMAQAEVGELPLSVAPVEIDDLLFEVFEQLKVFSDGGHDIGVTDIEPVIINGDRDRIKQVLLNLGVNAVNHTPKGTQIQLGMRTQKNWVAITVSDTGPGIPKGEIGRLFERFHRGNKSRTRNQKKDSFGLGLPIAYWIVRSHGGRIEVHSEIDVGTTFTVWLPKSQADVPTRPLEKPPDKL